jgi:hypothetical protein
MGFMSFIPLITPIISKIFTNKGERDAAEARVRELELRGELEPMLKQIEVNVQEGRSTSLFIAGWRPAAAWMCVGAMFIGFLVSVVLPAIIGILPVMGYENLAKIKQVAAVLGSIDISIYVTMLMGLLGLGFGTRMYEKLKGVERNNWQRVMKTMNAAEFLLKYGKKVGKVTKEHEEVIREIFRKMDKS